MFKVGDRVFCPMRGCGVVEVIEERTMLDKVQEYFIIKIFTGNMTVMVPTDRISSSRFRPIGDLPTAEAVLSTIAEKNVQIDEVIPVKQRFKNNTVKISSGSLEEYAEVIRDLSHIQKSKPLNAGERSMLMDARKYLVDEISLIKDVSKDQVNCLLDSLLA
ncbi:MAG: CarD family transcriptional regulator [Cellulosilyticaceae bacterium]